MIIAAVTHAALIKILIIGLMVTRLHMLISTVHLEVLLLLLVQHFLYYVEIVYQIKFKQ